MAWHNETGKKGELLASEWLRKQGFEILELNWRFSYYEIDIIASQAGILHFIEVKTRKSLLFGNPEDDVSDKKLESLMNAAEEYLERNPCRLRVQYDVLSITMLRDREPEFYFVQDVYL
jgi:putative endonuclease